MRYDLDYLREEAMRARWWAISVPSRVDRERLETIARDYEQQIRALDQHTEATDRRNGGG
jgi:hypothetical protein